MDFTKLKNYMDKLIKEDLVPGVDCIVYKEHEVLFRYFTGMRDIENNKKTDGKELYFIFSMTKMMTCVSALQLFEKGKYKLTDPISKYLPEFEKMKIMTGEFDTGNSITSGKSMAEGTLNEGEGYAKNPITVLDLFTMGAGLDYNISTDAIKKTLAEGRTSTRDLVGAMSETVLGFEPGTRFRYSLCHDVLGALIEVWSGMKFGEYMSENLFKPLGISNTTFGMPKDEKKKENIAALYTHGEDRKPIRRPCECALILSDEYESGGAGLVSCTEDYAIFLDALANGGVAKNGNRILKEETIALMGRNHLCKKQYEDFQALRKGYGYGLGVRVHCDKEKSGSKSPIGEFGWDGAMGAFSMVDPENKLSLAYFQHIGNWELKIQNDMRNVLYSCFE